MNRSSGLLLSGLLGLTSLVAYALVLLVPENEQPWLTPLLVGLSVIFAVVWCMAAADKKAGERIDPFHPAILFLVFYLGYFVFSGVLVWRLHDYDSAWVNLGQQPAFVVNSVFFLGILSVAAFGIGMRAKIAFPVGALRKVFSRKNALRLGEMRYLVYLFFVVGIGFTTYHLSLFGSFSIDIFRYLSPAAQRDLEINLSQFFIIFESMLSWAALLAVFRYLQHYVESGRRHGNVMTLLLLAAVVVITYVVSGKRSAVIPLLLMPLIWHHYLVRSLSVARAGAYLTIGLVVVSTLLFVRVVVPLLLRGLDPTDYLGGGLWDAMVFYFDSGELSTFDMISASLTHRDQLLAEMGGPLWGLLKYSFGTLVALVPRAIWPDKPGYEDPGHIYYQVLIGSNEDVAFAVTVWGTSFLFFHVAGILFGMFILGWVFRGMYALLQPWKRQPLNVFLYAIFYWIAFQFLRFGTLGFTLIFFLQTMLVGMLAGFFLARRTHRATFPDTGGGVRV